MSSRAVCLALTAAVLTPAPTAAATHGPPAPEVDGLLHQQAAAHWQRGRECGHGTFDPPPPGVAPGAAWAEVGGCRVWVDPTHWAQFGESHRCVLVAHELGHLLGLGHTEDRRDVMYEGGPWWSTVSACDYGVAAPVTPPARTGGPQHLAVPRRRVSRRRCKRGHRYPLTAKRICKRIRKAPSSSPVAPGSSELAAAGLSSFQAG